MMIGWGKIIGAFFGFLFQGPFGAIVGILIGHFFDRGLAENSHRTNKNQNQAQTAFFNATFLVLGYIAKVDGRVSEAEIQVARNAMHRLNLNQTQKLRAIELFNQGKKTDFDLKHILAQLAHYSQNNKGLLHIFIEIQQQAVQADGRANLTKQKIFQSICQALGVSSPYFTTFEDLFNFTRHQNYSYSNSSQSHSQSHQQAYRSKSGLGLQEAYATLGVSEKVNDAEIKRAYRRLMSKHHPDKLASKGVPEAAMKIATEKAQKIKASYEKICSVRNMR